MGVKGNTFWKLREKHGRDPKYKDPEELASVFMDYLQWCEDNPIKEIDYRGKDAVMVYIPRKRILQKNQFALFAGYSSWDHMLNLSKQDKGGNVNYTGFSDIITRIEHYIQSEQLAGASANVFNSNIVSRLLGLSDKKQIEVREHEMNAPKSIQVHIIDGDQNQ
jgi:hypothetical protein